MRFLILSVIFLVQGQNSLSQDAELSDSTPTEIVKIGEPCTRDYQCIKHAFCRVQSTCWCDPFYAPGPDSTICHATAGLGCQSNDECATMANAECLQGVCTCKDNFILDITNSSNCISRPVKDGDRCQRTDECVEAMDRSLCINEKCKCISDFRFVNETGKCVPVRGIYQPCRYNYECYDSKIPDALTCDGGSCEYKPGYGDASSHTLSTHAIIVGVCAIFLSY